MENIIFDLLVVGTGGTGSYLLKEFSRFLTGQKLSDLNIGKLVMADGDVVEEHNLSRQCFVKDDIGEKKALILCEALNDNFELSWSAFPKYILKESEIVTLIGKGATNGDINRYNPLHIPVILGCVDNHGCRLLLEQYFNNADNCIYFDSANEEFAGEVVFSYKIKGEQLSCLRSQIFPDLKEGDTRSIDQMSCEELNVHSPQHIATNMKAGQILLSALCALLRGKYYPGFTSFDEMTEEFIPRLWKKGEQEDE